MCASVLVFFIVSYHADSCRSLDSLSECWYGSLQGPSRRRPGTVALSWQQAVRFKGKHPITVIRNIQELTVTPRRPQALHWLVSDLYGNTGLQPEQKKVWNIISRKLTEQFLISIHLSATSEMTTNPVFVTLTQHDNVQLKSTFNVACTNRILCILTLLQRQTVAAVMIILN